MALAAVLRGSGKVNAMTAGRNFGQSDAHIRERIDCIRRGDAGARSILDAEMARLRERLQMAPGSVPPDADPATWRERLETPRAVVELLEEFLAQRRR